MLKSLLKQLYVITFVIFIISINCNKTFAQQNIDKIHFLETLGFGDAIVIQSNDQFALIDCGEDYDQNAKFIAKFLNSLGTNKIDYFIMSHAHSDHIGSFESLSKLIKIDKFIGMDLKIEIDTVLRENVNGEDIVPKNHPFFNPKSNELMVPSIELKSWNTDIYYQKMLIALAEQGIYKDDPTRFIIPKENNKIRLGNYILQFNNTFRNFSDIPLIKTDFNATSTWITLFKNDIKIALPGDIPGQQGDIVVNKNEHTNNVDLYKIAHHGYISNTTENMIQKLSPSISVAMGAPDSTIIDRLLSTYGSDVFFTKENNNIISVTLSDDKIILDNNYITHYSPLHNQWLKLNGNYYYYINDELVKDCSLEINNIWYRFDKNGIMLSDTWYTDENNKTYYYEKSGAMSYNKWSKKDNIWYRFDENGIRLENTLFTDSNNDEYYLSNNGEMIKNCWYDINGNTYRFNNSGIMLKNAWYYHDNNYYFLDSEGLVVYNSWLKDSNGYWYYLKDNGVMISNNWYNINGSWYRFDSSGKMLSNTWFKDEYSTWYYLKDNGVMISNNWHNINGSWYRFDSSGKMLSNTWFKDEYSNWYYLKDNGSMISNNWHNINGSWYRFDSSGKMLSNTWFKDEYSNWYYLKSSGIMASNETLYIDNKYYTFNINGIML